MRNIDWFPLSRQAGTRHCLQLGVVMKRKFSSSENSRPSPDLSNVLINSWPFPGLENSISNSRTFPEFPTAWQPWSNDLPKTGFPTRAWHRQPSVTNSIRVSEGRRPEHFFDNPGTVLNLQLRPSIYMGLFFKNVYIALNPTKNLSM